MKKAVLFFAVIIAVVALTSSKLSTTNNETSALTSSEITNPCNTVLAYKSAQESDYFKIAPDGTVQKVGESGWVSYKKNPYANDEMCSPGKKWCTCFEYTFNWGGTTYYFNK